MNKITIISLSRILAVCPNVTLKGIKNLAPLRLDSIQLASLGSAAPLDEEEVFELAKQILPGCEISTLNYKSMP